MKNTLFLLPIFLFINISCKKECTDPLCQLPPATQTGANTMGCLVNGQPWLPDTRDNGGIPRLKPIYVSFWNTNTEFFFQFYLQKTPISQSIVFYIKNFSGIGVYRMDSLTRLIGPPGSSGVLNNHFNFSENKLGLEYATGEKFHGVLKIQYYDATSKIIAGSFNFKAGNIQNPSDSVVVTHGRFDCKMD
ncbi:hypothetical protein [Aridibaculum aurantiacum]|uniref:hypothetical protein n=1 Tax=Aridibaculum aurantiacum TaxID=2810307 RepID=UPI001A95A4A3|nr:hypothetical protein [Aridibaculum aurantiacum]